MEKENAIPQDFYDAMSGLWNGIYREYNLGEVYWKLSQNHATVQVEWVLKSLPDNLRNRMLVAYNILHKYNPK